MIDIILNFNTGTEIKKLNSSYDEITFGQYLSILKNNKIKNVDERVIENISVLSGIPTNEVKLFPENYINGIIPFLEFLDKIDNINFIPVPDDFKINVGAESWGKLEQAKICVQTIEDMNLVFAIPKIVEIYLGGLYDETIEETKSLISKFEEYKKLEKSKNKSSEFRKLNQQLQTLECQKEELKNFEQMSFVKAFPIAKYLIDQFETFHKKYTRLQDFQPEVEQLQAGIEQLNQYGFFTTLHSLSKGNPILYDDMLALPADNIYQTLVMDFENSEYQKRYNELIKNKK